VPRSARKKRANAIAEAPRPPTATPPVHMTLVGVGVDLSVSAVERISAIPGARYVSVINAAEFFATVVEDFNYDVTPIAFDIRLQLPAGVAFQRIYGSAELNAVKDGATEATISSEFPVHLDADGCTHGGLYLCKLKISCKAAAEAARSMQVSWTDPTGTRRACAVTIRIPGAGQDPDSVDVGLRKAAALAEYVQHLTDFAAQAESAAGGAARDAQCSEQTAAALVVLRAAGATAAINDGGLPADIPTALAKNCTTVSRFTRLRRHLQDVMAAAQDTSLTGCNANVLQTIDQVITLETAEVEAAINLLRTRTGT
jgi:hypothetical protein